MAGDTQTKEIKMIGKDILLVLIVPLLLVLIYSFSARVYLSSLETADDKLSSDSSIILADSEQGSK